MRLLCDAMLARLGRWLRMLGFDTLIAGNTVSDEEVLRKTKRTGRVLLTRDKLLFRKAVKAKVKSIYLKEKEIKKQLSEFFRVAKAKSAFPQKSRCSVCNGPLKEIEKEKAKEKVPAGVYKRQKQFWQCTRCKKIYWHGSHWEKIMAVVKKLKGDK